ncbi:hypothetical protein D3C80_1363290 [compost metagenome]
MGEVDHADNAVNHRIANCDQAIDRTKSQPVDELLDKILHIFPRMYSLMERISFISFRRACKTDPYEMHNAFERNVKPKRKISTKYLEFSYSLPHFGS